MEGNMPTVFRSTCLGLTVEDKHGCSTRRVTERKRELSKLTVLQRACDGEVSQQHREVTHITKGIDVLLSLYTKTSVLTNRTILSVGFC